MWCDHPGCSQLEGYLHCAITVFHNVAPRPAKVGDELVTTKFDFLTRGFAAIGEPNVAVCLLPGTEVAFESDSRVTPGEALSPELSRSCPSGLRDGAGCLRWQELPRFSADPFRLAGVHCIAALWRVKSLLRHRHRPDGLRRRPPCCFSVASWLLRTRRHGVISDLEWTFVHFCSCLPSMQIMTRPPARFAPSA
jgi:hypothetical protein